MCVCVRWSTHRREDVNVNTFSQRTGMHQACKKPWGQTPKEEGRGEEKEGRGRKMEQRTGERVGRKLGEEEEKKEEVSCGLLRT